MDPDEFEPELSYFHFICERNNHEAIEIALQCSERDRKIKIDSTVNNDVDQSYMAGFTALHFAARNGNVKTVKLLLEHGADINAVSSSIGTPMIVSILFDQKEVFSELLQNGANVNILDNDQDNAYQLMIESESSYEEEKTTIFWINRLHEAGCNINQQNSFGSTLLHRVPEYAIQAVLDCNPDINLKNNNGQTAFNFQESIESYNVGPVFYTNSCKYIVQLDLINYPVNEQNRSFLRNAIENNKISDQDFSEHKRRCLSAINYLKSIKLSRCASMYDVLHFSAENLSCYMANQILIDVCNMNNFDSKFYCYSFILKKKLKEADARNELVQEAIFILRNIFGMILPMYCIERTIYFLSNSDLEYLKNN